MLVCMLKCLVLAPNPDAERLRPVFELGKRMRFNIEPLRDRAERPAQILSANFLVADLSGNDPAVIYDLGVAHTFGKPVFLIADTLNALPYDLRGNRTFAYGHTSNEHQLGAALMQFLRLPYAIGPVRFFVGKYAYFGEPLAAPRVSAFLIDVLSLVAVLAAYLVTEIGDDGALSVTTLSWAKLTRLLSHDSVVKILAAGVVGMPFMTWLFGGTLGQLLMGLRVVQADIRRPTLGQCFGRMMVLAFGGYVFAYQMMVGPSYRALHDSLSGTTVIKHKKHVYDSGR
jgi:uncharacterized RDD family membrane protein YckC